MKKTLKQQGFTLHELLIWIGILGILSAIAYPLYQNFIKNGRLKEAQQALLINAQHLEKYYQNNLTFKKNSTTWADLALNQTEFFCIKMQGVARGAADGKFTIKAVAFNKNQESRVIIINQDHMITQCENSTSSCGEKQAYFSNAGRSDKNCTIIN